MKQKKRIWWTFNLWEADAFQQYLEEMALQGWFLENVGGSVMKFYRAQPEKRRYAALLVPGSSSLTRGSQGTAGRQNSFARSARKQDGIFNAAELTGRYFIPPMKA